jgi:hypothetical protein
MDSTGGGAVHQSALPCQGSPRHHYKRGLATMRLSQISMAMDQEVGHFYALFGVPDEDEARVKGQRQAKAWMAKAHESVERAREHIGSHLRKVSGLDLVRYCQHDGPPAESLPCSDQAQAAIQRASRAWEDNPGLIRGLCGASPGAAGRSIRGMVPVEAPATDSEFPPDLTDSESDSDSSYSEDSDSSDSETEDSPPVDIELRGQGPFTSDTNDSDSSSTYTGDSDSPGARLRVRGSRWKWPRAGTDMAAGRNQPDYERVGHLATDE